MDRFVVFQSKGRSSITLSHTLLFQSRRPITTISVIKITVAAATAAAAAAAAG